jgi:hypothetical protein
MMYYFLMEFFCVRILKRKGKGNTIILLSKNKGIPATYKCLLKQPTGK